MIGKCSPALREVIDRSNYVLPVEDYIKERKAGLEPMIGTYKVLMVHEVQKDIEVEIE